MVPGYLPANFQSICSAAGLKDGVSAGFQLTACQNAQRTFVLDQQDHFCSVQRGQKFRLWLWHNRAFRLRQIDLEGCPRIGLTRHVDIAATLFDHPVDHGKAKTSSFSLFLRREKRLEDARPRGRIHPDARVADRQ